MEGGRKLTQKKNKQHLQKQNQWFKSYFTAGAKQPGAYAGLQPWLKENHAPIKNDSRKPLSKTTIQKHKDKEQQMKSWLEAQTTYAMHRPAPKKYARRPFVVHGLDHQWQIDLSDMQWHKNDNDGFAWIMFVIDVLSRYLWVQPMKRKTAEESQRAYDLILQQAVQEGHQPPIILHADKGTEFHNSVFKEYLKKPSTLVPFAYPTRLIHSESKIKSGIVERVQRTIKTRLWKVFYQTGSYRWVDVIQDVVASYNASFHRSIKRSPDSVHLNNEDEVRQTLYGDYYKRREAFHEQGYKYQVGDVVRISKEATLFRKGYLPQWSEEWFRIRERDPGPPPYYRLEDWKGTENIQGTFYTQELQSVSEQEQKEGVQRIEKVLQRRGTEKGEEVLVKYKGWPEHYNEWIDAKRVVDLS